MHATIFKLKGIITALLLGAVGVFLMRMAVSAWLVGEITRRGELIKFATQPVQFTAQVAVLGLLGLLLACAAPIWAYQTLNGSEAKKAHIARVSQKIFGGTRPSIFWLGLVIIGGSALAVIIKRCV